MHYYYKQSSSQMDRIEALREEVNVEFIIIFFINFRGYDFDM